MEYLAFPRGLHLQTTNNDLKNGKVIRLELLIKIGLVKEIFRKRTVHNFNLLSSGTTQVNLYLNVTLENSQNVFYKVLRNTKDHYIQVYMLFLESLYLNLPSAFL